MNFRYDLILQTITCKNPHLIYKGKKIKIKKEGNKHI